MSDGSWVIKHSDHGYTFFYQLPDGKYGASETLPTLEQAYQNMLESREANLKYPDDSNALTRYRADKDAEKSSEAGPNSSKLVTKTEAKKIYDSLSIRHSWLTGGTTEEFFRQNYPESINEALTDAKALLERPFGKVATASGLKQSIERMVQSVENTIERWKAGKTEDAPKTKTYPPVEDLGNGFYRAFKNDKRDDDWIAHINPNGEWEVSANNAQSQAWNRGYGAPRFFKTIEEMMVKYPAFRSLPALLEAKAPDGNEPDDTGNEASTDDADYLNKVIKGEVDFSNSSEVEAQLEAIGGRLAPEINDLFEQAVTAYSVYQVDQAKLIN